MPVNAPQLQFCWLIRDLHARQFYHIYNCSNTVAYSACYLTVHILPVLRLEDFCG